MTKFKSIPLIIFSTSLLTAQWFNLLLGEQPANAEENIDTTSQPLEVATKVRYCNRTPQAINAAIGYSPNFTAWNWRTLNPGKCRTVTWENYKGRVDFFVSVDSLGINGNQPAFRKQVDAGNNCYMYVQNGSYLFLKRDSCS
jgi:Protein of unknown function (DUF1036)